jgi:glycosyltransferase involved in cell wall biosynthesis
MNILRIALITPGIPRISGGPSVAIAELATHLATAGHEVTIVTADLSPYGGPPDSMVEVDGRVELELFPVHTRWDRRMYRSIEMRRWLNEAVRDFDVVDIQGVWSFITVDAAWACLRAGIPYILTPHGQMAQWDWEKRFWQKRVFFKLFLQKIWHSAAAIRFVSEGEVRHSAIKARTLGEVIPYSVSLPCLKDDGQDASDVLCEIGIPADVPVVLFLGRVTAQKGVLDLVEGFNCLWARQKDVFLLIVGPLEGDYGSAVIDRVKQLPGGQNIRLLGPLYGERKYGALTASSLFVTLSKNEGLPNAVLEAMAWGLPVVLTEESNFPEVEKYGAGKVVRAKPENVADILERLLREPAQLKQMGESARRLIEEHFTWEKVLPQVLSLYERVARQRLK